MFKPLSLINARVPLTMQCRDHYIYIFIPVLSYECIKRAGYDAASKSCYYVVPVSNHSKTTKKSPVSQKPFPHRHYLFKKRCIFKWQTVDRTPSTANKSKVALHYEFLNHNICKTSLECSEANFVCHENH